MPFYPDEDSRLGPWFGWCIRILVVYSVIMYMIEINWGHSENSRLGCPVYLWSERIVALLLTIEIGVRFYHAKERRGLYLKSGYFVLDLLSVLPFWVGFLLPVNPAIYLRMVRTCRIFRLLKLIRYMPRAQLLLRAICSCLVDLVPVAFLCFIVFLFGSVSVYEVERNAQPDKFSSLGDSMWWMWITLTTVGYGDLAPITAAGRWLAVITMILGLGLIAGYVGIVANTVYNAFKLEVDEHGNVIDVSRPEAKAVA